MLLKMILALLCAGASVLTNCAWDAGYRKGAGPAMLRDGVEIRVLGQECYLNRSADEVVRVDEDLLDIKVKLQLKNDTDTKLTVYPQQITLFDSKVDTGPSHQSHPAAAFDVAPGQSRRFDVFFSRGGELDCSAELRLELGRSVTVHGAPVAMPALNLAER